MLGTKILVIDDDANICEMLRLYLENEGYSMGEDMTMIKLMSCIGDVAYVNEALYHYVQLNSSSMMQNCFSDNHIMALKHNCEDVVAYLKKKYADDYNVSIAYRRTCQCV